MAESDNRIATAEFDAARLRAVALRQQAMRELVDALWRGMTAPMALTQGPMVLGQGKPAAPRTPC